MALVLLAAAATGCSAGEPEKSPQPTAAPRLTAGQICAGLFTGEGAKALERVLESTAFHVRDDEKAPDVRAVAQVMEDAYRAGKRINDMPQPVCEASGAEAKAGYIPTVRIMFTAYSKHAGDPPDFPGVSDSGVMVSQRQKTNHLSYDCTSSRVGSTDNVPLRIKLAFQERWDGSKGETVLGQDYLAVTHSAALAVAKELGCTNNGGLPARADDLPKPEGGS
ncbi:hypothetical protein ACFXB3_17845 [Streptomyces sp. NPDC059447]|uniref:hypothetical protein n=1 Tax=Streptomyces sp. NPDC059447 TaxID=3346834 RepID=UPI00367B4DB8